MWRYSWRHVLWVLTIHAEREWETGVLRMKIKWCSTGDCDVNQAAKRLWLKGRSYLAFSAFIGRETINKCNCFFCLFVEVFDSNKRRICLLMYATADTLQEEQWPVVLFVFAGTYLWPLPLVNTHFFIACVYIQVCHWFSHTAAVMHMLCHTEHSIRWELILDDKRQACCGCIAYVVGTKWLN